jgi:hypothetical protein
MVGSPSGTNARPEVPQNKFPPTPTSRSFPSASGGNVGACKISQEIEANWAGGWISGTIVEPLGPGFRYYVQLEDRRFPHPLVLATNLLRPQ